MTTRRPDYAAAAIGMLEDAAQATSVTAQQTMITSAQAFATIALVEEQRTANLIAAYNGDLLKNPHPVGTEANNEWWAKTAGDLTERVGVQR